jgi:AAA+ superfamily predicted ATPase
MKLHSIDPASLPTNDNGLSLLKERAVVRGEQDIILHNDTRLSLAKIIRENKRSDTLLSYGVRPARKILFFGPPGCGKTLAAEVIANELSMPIFLVRWDAVISSFLGETIANLRKVFDYIVQHPVVVLFDEFDTIAKNRDDGNDHGELKRSVNAVLQRMDEYQGEGMIVATTNYELLLDLDKDIWRRFDEVLRFERPNLEHIKQLIALKLSGVRRNFEADDAQVASLFNGMSHADIGRVLLRAVKEMILSGSEFMEKNHLDTALARDSKKFLWIRDPKSGVISYGKAL